jgi:hypothetical protein
MVVKPSHPVPGAFLQVNELSSSRRVDILDALLGDTYDASSRRSNPVYVGRRLMAAVIERPLKPVSHSTHGYTESTDE